MNIKRFLCAFLLMATIFGFAACNGNISNENENNNAENLIDFNSHEFIIRDHDHGGTYDIIPVFGENLLDDLILERYDELRNLYNCKITLEEGDSNGLTEASAAGLRYADIMYDKINRAFPAIKLGLYRDVSKIEELDLSSGKYGSTKLLESLVFNDATYMIYPPTWANHFAHVLIYNPQMIQSYNLYLPSEYYEKELWNWDTFETMAKAVTDKSSENKNDHTAIMSLSDIVADCVIYSNGGQWVKKTDDGQYRVAFNSSETIQAIDYIAKLYKGGYLFDNKQWQLNADLFLQERVPFYANYSWMGISKDGGYIPTNFEKPFSWIGFPIGPNGNNDSNGVLTATNPFYLITAEANESVIGQFAYLLFEQLGGNGENNNWFDIFERENFFDEFSFNYYIQKLNTVEYDYSIFFSKSTLDAKIASAAKGNRSASETVESLVEKAQAELDANLNSFIN